MTSIKKFLFIKPNPEKIFFPHTINNFYNIHRSFS